MGDKFLELHSKAKLYEKAKEKLRFCCYSCEHVIKDCTQYVGRKVRYSRRYHGLLHLESSGQGKFEGRNERRLRAEVISILFG